MGGVGMLLQNKHVNAVQIETINHFTKDAVRKKYNRELAHIKYQSKVRQRQRKELDHIDKTLATILKSDK